MQLYRQMKEQTANPGLRLSVSEGWEHQPHELAQLQETPVSCIESTCPATSPNAPLSPRLLGTLASQGLFGPLQNESLLNP